MNLSRIEAIYEESTNGELEDRADYRPSFLCNLGVNKPFSMEEMSAVLNKISEDESAG